MRLKIGTILVATRNRSWGISGYDIIEGKHYKVVRISPSKTFFRIMDENDKCIEILSSTLDDINPTFITLKEQRRAKLESIL